LLLALALVVVPPLLPAAPLALALALALALVVVPPLLPAAPLVVLLLALALVTLLPALPAALLAVLVLVLVLVLLLLPPLALAPASTVPASVLDAHAPPRRCRSSTASRSPLPGWNMRLSRGRKRRLCGTGLVPRR